MGAGSSGWMPTDTGHSVEALEAAEARAEAWQAVAAIRLLALTGCRKGEILRLKRTEVDVANRCLRLRDTKTTSNETAPSVRPLE